MTDTELINQTKKLAGELYKANGYESPNSESFDWANSDHPNERLMWRMACIAQEVLTCSDVDNALHELEVEVVDSIEYRTIDEINVDLDKTASKHIGDMSYNLYITSFGFNEFRLLDSTGNIFKLSINDEISITIGGIDYVVRLRCPEDGSSYFVEVFNFNYEGDTDNKCTNYFFDEFITCKSVTSDDMDELEKYVAQNKLIANS